MMRRALPRKIRSITSLFSVPEFKIVHHTKSSIVGVAQYSEPTGRPFSWGYVKDVHRNEGMTFLFALIDANAVNTFTWQVAIGNDAEVSTRCSH